MISANQSGTVNDDQLVDVSLGREHLGDEVDPILRGEAQGTTRASTILGMSGDPTILRQGDIDAPALRSVLGDDPL